MAFYLSMIFASSKFLFTDYLAGGKLKGRHKGNPMSGLCRRRSLGRVLCDLSTVASEWSESAREWIPLCLPEAIAHYNCALHCSPSSPKEISLSPN